jgi:RNA polymerase sigma-70 factor (ECF subfamily)
MSRDSDRDRASRAMDRYAEGDEAAFAVLYDVLAPSLYGFAMNLARHRALAEDVVQQTFLQIHRARGRWVPGADLVPWAYSIAHHVFIDLTRRSRRELLRQTEASGEEDVPSKEPGVDDELDHRRRLAELLGQIRHLPEKLRLAFQLVVVEELSIAEAAEVLGITSTNVKVRVHRAREALKKR